MSYEKVRLQYEDYAIKKRRLWILNELSYIHGCVKEGNNYA